MIGQNEHSVYIDDNDFIWLVGNDKPTASCSNSPWTESWSCDRQADRQADSNSTEPGLGSADIAVIVAAKRFMRGRLQQPARGGVRSGDRRL
jgi:hypothetical protein